jgi:hypothetical protein
MWRYQKRGKKPHTAIIDTTLSTGKWLKISIFWMKLEWLVYNGVALFIISNENVQKLSQYS